MLQCGLSATALVLLIFKTSHSSEIRWKQKLLLSPDMGLSKALVCSVLVRWLLFSFSSLCSSGIICGPISTSELIGAADGNCRLITGLISLPNGNSCDPLFVNLLTHGKHYPSTSFPMVFTSTLPTVLSGWHIYQVRPKSRKWDLRLEDWLPKIKFPLLAWKHTMVERLPDKNWLLSEMSWLPGDGEMFPLVVKLSVIGHLLIALLRNRDNRKLTVGDSSQKLHRKRTFFNKGKLI